MGFTYKPRNFPGYKLVNMAYVHYFDPRIGGETIVMSFWAEGDISTRRAP
jgi:hypothetical protein